MELPWDFLIIQWPFAMASSSQYWWLEITKKLFMETEWRIYMYVCVKYDIISSDCAYYTPSYREN